MPPMREYKGFYIILRHGFWEVWEEGECLYDQAVTASEAMEWVDKEFQ